MLDFFSDFDSPSFWLGFVAALLFTWLSRRLFPLLRSAVRSIRSRAAARRETLRIGVEFDYRNDLIRHLQGLHLASALFSLDEILVAPRVLAPPPQTIPGEDHFLSDRLSKILPYMPDVPEFASAFGAEKISLADTLRRGANVAVLGPAGSGKSTALVHLGTQIAALSPDAGPLADLIPFHVHAADLTLPVSEESDPFDLIRLAVLNGGYLSRITLLKFDELIHTAHTESRALLLLDGLDELPPAALERITETLRQLLRAHPHLRIVVSASSEYFNGLTALGLHPVVMAAWTNAERTHFIRRWGDQWARHIDPEIWSAHRTPVELQIVRNWLMNERSAQTPLELTLRAWAFFAGDSAGPTNLHSFDAYLRRIVSTNPAAAETALERIGMQMALTQRTIIHVRAAGHWSRGDMVEDIPDTPLDDPFHDIEETNGRPGRVGRATVPSLLTGGILVLHAGETIRFCHPVFAGYYAGRGVAGSGGAGTIAAQNPWELRTLTLHYLASRTDASPLLAEISRPDPMHFALFTSGRWLRDMPVDSPARRLLMRQLVGLFQDSGQPAILRQRALAGLALSSDPAVVPFCKKMLADPDPLARSMAALGLGHTHDSRALRELSAAAADPAFVVRAAACFALVQLGLKEGIDTVAETLLHGDEDTRHAAAEALAIDPEDGLEILLEASREEDLMVRRAAVFGLAKSESREAAARLERLQLEDEQWIVRNAANQELLRMEQGSPAVPKPLEALHHTGWLIAFAGESGEGLAPGRAAQDTLFRALIHGDPEQKMAAMDRYRLSGSDPVWTAAHELLDDPNVEVQNAAFQLLWHLRGQGFTTQETALAETG